MEKMNLGIKNVIEPNVYPNLKPTHPESYYIK